MTATTLTYCYAVARPFTVESSDFVRGVVNTEIRLIEHGELVAIVSSVPADQFGEDELRASLEDLRWLESIARAHNGVVEQAAQLAVTLPFRLATIYLDDNRVREVLRQSYELLISSLNRFSGRDEWGVKIYTTQQDSGVDATETESGSGEHAGRSYLRRRLEQRNSRESMWQAAAEHAEGVDTTLTEFADDRHQHRVQNAELSHTHDQNVLNVAYLIPRDRRSEFLARVEQLRGSSSDYRLEVTGPWVPYSFIPSVHSADEPVDTST